MKKIIIIVAAVLVLLIASVFGLAMFAPTVLPGFMQNLLGVAPEAVLEAVGAPEGEKLMGAIWYGHPQGACTT